jgi:hypothetical protein
LQLKPHDIPFNYYKDIAAWFLRKFSTKNNDWAEKYKDYTYELARALELDESRSLQELKTMQNPDGTMRDPPHDQLAKALLTFTHMVFTAARGTVPKINEDDYPITLKTYSSLPASIQESVDKKKKKARDSKVGAVVYIEIDLPPSVTTSEERGVFALDKTAEFCEFLDKRMTSGQRQRVLSIRLCQSEKDDPDSKREFDNLEMYFADPVDFAWLQYALREYPKFHEIKRWDKEESTPAEAIKFDTKTVEKFRRYGTYLNDEKVPICQAFLPDSKGECDKILESYEKMKLEIQASEMSRYIRISALKIVRKYLLEYVNTKNTKQQEFLDYLMVKVEDEKEEMKEFITKCKEESLLPK